VLADCQESIGKEINVCSNNEISMDEVLAVIQKILNTNVRVSVEAQRKRPDDSEVYRLWGDNSLIKSMTGFQTQYSLLQGLEITCNWFRNEQNLKKYKPTIYNV
jgi:nucleoside-diphosphate-sugar epimerase